MTKKSDMLKNSLGKKKTVPDEKEVEKITKEVYGGWGSAKGQPMQKTTLDLPKELHTKAKIFAMEQGKSLKGYIKELIEDDLKENGKL